jgi:hypothetical protein
MILGAAGAKLFLNFAFRLATKKLSLVAMTTISVRSVSDDGKPNKFWETKAAWCDADHITLQIKTDIKSIFS